MAKAKKDLFSHDTIAAIATPLGPGGVGVIRVSGKKSLSILRKIFRANKGRFRLSSHKMIYGQVVLSGSKRPSDKGLAVYMKGPNSYTGEDVVELNLHGSVPVLRSILSHIIDLGARLARRGEFTKRAFLNGKIDLAQAEAVLDLVKSRTSFSASAAAGQLEGVLSKEVHLLREKLISLLAGIEVSIDFPDDISTQQVGKIRGVIDGAVAKIDTLLESSDAGRIVRDGALVAIIGRPNVGKSSLLNALLREERVIVTAEPGTTRDTIEEGINVLGIPVRAVDTAGLRKARGEAEARGIDRTHKSVGEADLILLVVDGSQPVKSEDQKLVRKYADRNLILVLNKSDKPSKLEIKKLLKGAQGLKRAKISALYGRRIKKLEALMYKALLGGFSTDIGSVLINSRHKECLQKARAELVLAAEALSKSTPIDLVAINLKEAIIALGEVTGEVVTEEVLTKIFDQFCVGK